MIKPEQVDMRQRRYLAYLLRLWLAESAGEPVWRGSLEDPHTGARLGFADLASLFEYLRRQDLETLAQTLAVFAQNAGLPPAQFRADLHTLLTLAGHPHPDAVLAVQAQPVPPLQAPYGPRAQPAGRADWGRAPDVSRFVGRAPELAQLGRWLLQDRRRLLGVFGLGGIGKTFLTRRAALDAAPGFTAVKWVLLQDGPPPDEVLAECIHFFSGYRDTDIIHRDGSPLCNHLFQIPPPAGFLCEFPGARLQRRLYLPSQPRGLGAGVGKNGAPMPGFLCLQVPRKRQDFAPIDGEKRHTRPGCMRRLRERR